MTISTTVNIHTFRGTPTVRSQINGETAWASINDDGTIINVFCVNPEMRDMVAQHISEALRLAALPPVIPVDANPSTVEKSAGIDMVPATPFDEEIAF